MIIKKFTGLTEEEAVSRAKEDLGKEAVVMNVKSVSPKGVMKYFKKPFFEITAAIDEAIEYRPRTEAQTVVRRELVQTPENGVYEVSAIERKLNDLQGLIEKQIAEASVNRKRETGDLSSGTTKESPRGAENNASLSMETPDRGGKKEEKESPEQSRLHACMQLVYRQLLHNEVDEKYVNELTSELESTIKKDAGIDRILAAVYQKLVLKLGQPSLIELMPGRPRYIFFLGPTGVGKTTTIAKIASSFKINQKVKVALLTADTYRIAAVEQLRTYANILGIPLHVVYSAEEIMEAKKILDKHELVLIDTAGRTDKNKVQIDELKRLIGTVPEEDREVYLVLSATTKYRDLARIIKSYEGVSKYKIIFTKIDETDTVGNLYNVLMQTKAPLSYVTFGQNVPDDIGKANIQSIAKQLLS